MNLVGFALLVLMGIAIQGCGTAADDCAVSFSTQTSGAEMGIVHTNFGGDAIAQSFALTESKEISKVQLYLQKVGSPSSTATVTVTIQGDGGGSPDGAPVATGSLTVSAISATGGFYTVTFASTVTLPTDTYWLVAQGSYAQSSTDFIQWLAHDGSMGGYDSGQAKYETSTAGTWNTTLIGTERDLLFKIGCGL